MKTPHWTIQVTFIAGLFGLVGAGIGALWLVGVPPMFAYSIGGIVGMAIWITAACESNRSGA